MQRVDANVPNTRARVAARRQQRKERPTARASARRDTTPEDREQARSRVQAHRTYGSARIYPGPRLTSTRRHLKASLMVPNQVLGRLRERTRTRQRARNTSDTGSQVRPGPRRTLADWLRSGKLVSLLLFLVTLSVLAYLFTSPDFRVQQVTVEGNTLLAGEQLAELSGLHERPIWFVDTSIAVERVLQNAYVEDVRISIALPNRATIAITEREPEVRWQAGNVQYLIDSSGRVLDVAAEPATPDTLVIIDSFHSGLEPKDYVDTDALDLARDLSLRLPQELGFVPAQIGWDIGLGVYVTSDSGQTIVFGKTDNLDRKLAVFDHLLREQTAFSYLDLRPSSPFYRVEG